MLDSLLILTALVTPDRLPPVQLASLDNRPTVVRESAIRPLQDRSALSMRRREAVEPARATTCYIGLDCLEVSE
jgi:hypothetical protein